MMRTRGVVLSCGAALWAVGASAGARAQPVISPVNGHNYAMTPTPLTWTEAEAYANLLGGNLATVRSAQEQAWINDTFFSGPNVTRQLWNGLNDEAVEGQFRWSSGEPVTYTNWSPGEPNNLINGSCSPQGEDYCTMNWYRAEGRPGGVVGQWNDTPVEGTHFGACVSPSRPGPFGLVEIADTDGDGLPDEWERNGIAYLDASGTLQRYILDSNGDGVSDANWQHKDLFVEVDALPGRMISAAASQMIIDAFANAPVSNPDGVNGVTLHLQVSDTSLTSATPWATDASGWAPEFDNLKQTHFGTGTTEERLAKAMAFRYAICADTIDDGSLGTAELPGNDFFITLGELSAPATVEQEAGTFMHELGHTLGLKHGGGDHVIGKPNYVSVMNYALTEPLPFSAAFWRLDFSREALPTLDECCLSEPAGIQSTHHTHIEMPFGVDDGTGGRLIRYVRLDGSATDWNDNGVATDSNVPQDLNYLGNGAPYAGVGSPSFTPPQTLTGFDDWANLQLGIGTTGDFMDFVHDTVPRDEPTAAMVEWMHEHLVGDGAGGNCPADWDGNGIVNSADVGAFLTSYFSDLTNGTLNADFDGNGVVTSADVGAYLTAYFASIGPCP